MKLQSTAKCLSQQQTQGQSWVAAACQQHPLSSVPPPQQGPEHGGSDHQLRPVLNSLPNIPNQKTISRGDKLGLRWQPPLTHKTHTWRWYPRTASVAVATSTHLPHRQMDTSVQHSQQGRAGSSGFLPARDLSKTHSISEGNEEGGVARAGGIPNPAAGPLPATRETRLIHPVLLLAFFFLN